MSGQRYTQYVSDAEYEALGQLAKEQGASRNYVARAALRNLLGFKVPRWVVMQQARADEIRRKREEAS